MKNQQKKKLAARQARIRRIRAKIVGTPERPRVVVNRSVKHIYVQFIDDTHGKTLVAASDIELSHKGKVKKAALARQVGQLVADKAAKKKIKTVVFDRRGYRYHGRVREVAEGLREKGLVF